MSWEQVSDSGVSATISPTYASTEDLEHVSALVALHAQGLAHVAGFQGEVIVWQNRERNRVTRLYICVLILAVALIVQAVTLAVVVSR